VQVSRLLLHPLEFCRWSCHRSLVPPVLPPGKQKGPSFVQAELRVLEHVEERSNKIASVRACTNARCHARHQCTLYLVLCKCLCRVVRHDGVSAPLVMPMCDSDTPMNPPFKFLMNNLSPPVFVYCYTNIVVTIVEHSLELPRCRT